MLTNYLIGLREGLEATLIVSILLAYLHKLGRGDRSRAVWLGAGGAVAASLAVGGVLAFTSARLSEAAREGFAGVLSLVAVVLVTTMVFWMRRTARGLSATLHARVDSALALGTGALVATAFVAVAREGVETAVFLWTAVASSGRTAVPLVGAAAGLATAVGLGWALYRRILSIDLGRFFTWTGVGLVVVAAGVLSYGLGDLRASGLLGWSGGQAYDISTHVASDGVLATLVGGTLHLGTQASWLQVGSWVTYLGVVLAWYLRPFNARPPRQGLAARSDPAGSSGSGTLRNIA